MICDWHLCTKILSGRQTKYCSKSCSTKKRVTDKRRQNKIDLIAASGSQCKDCDLIGPPFIFDFDHREPSLKKFAISGEGRTIAYATLLTESEKCDLVCAVCHRYRTHRQTCSGCDSCYRII